MNSDYLKQILKPQPGQTFTWEEIERRLAAHEASKIIRYGILELNSDSNICKTGDREIKLTNRECSLLYQLMLSKGATADKVYVTEKVYSRYTYENERGISVYINRLRKHLNGVAQIVTISSVGFRLLVESIVEEE